LGILVFALALMIRPSRLTKGLAAVENTEEDLVGGTRAHARYVLMVYSTLTAIGIGLLSLCGAGFFNALVYSFSAISTGGFAPHDASLAAVANWTQRTIIIGLCLAGSLSFVFYRQIYWKGLGVIVRDRQTQAVVVACLLTAFSLGLSMWILEDRSLGFVIGNAPILGISAQSTAGFTTMDISELNESSKLILILSMAVGGGVGSTAGGFKLLRLLIVLKLVSLFLSRTGMPSDAYTPRRLGGHKLEAEEIEQALSLILIFVALIALSWLPFVAAGYDPLDSLFEVVSATGTVGLSAGVVGPDLPSPLKGILCAGMLLGRLEIMAWLVLIYPRTWLGRRRDLTGRKTRRKS
jgi:trk system potassium uptake protein TrkH